MISVCFKDSFDLEIKDIASDKSISHRCAIFSLLSDKSSVIKNFLRAEDTLSTLRIVKALGARVEDDGKVIKITPPNKIKEPSDILDCGNSGTAIRLLLGFLSARDGFFVLSGDKYLNSRPMKRVVNPLRSIGAKIYGRSDGEFAPLCVIGNDKLKSFKYDSKIASAQVKTAMILTAIRADKSSQYKEPTLSRDHSEKMLNVMGANIEIDGCELVIHPLTKYLKPLDIKVPNDPSSGFFFAVAAAITKNSQIRLKNMLLNKTRIEAYKVLAKMGAVVEFIKTDTKYEDIGDIIIKNAPLKGVEVSKNIAWLIDELPALSIAFAVANGKSRVKNAKELRVKESDRISTIVRNLKKCNIKVDEFEDGYEIEGGVFKSAKIDSYGDHRIAMSFAIAGLLAPMRIEDVDCINTSFPNFVTLLSKIAKVETK
ncbi:MAG: 3-phosphoshikimate 1-carboxyvinyltransferase [Epsilonproteobacteria bacterium]|nr:3-phosphoshikimate 1-carboxyvinyltransferase [Campylobacterota bacterium]